MGIEVWQQSNKNYISQAKYASKLLQKFRIDHSNPSKPPMEVNLKVLEDDKFDVVNELFYRQLVEGLIYLTNTMPENLLQLVCYHIFLTVPGKHGGMQQRGCFNASKALYSLKLF